MAKKLMKGCEAIAEAAIQAGCSLYFGYPITPQTELSEYMAARLPKIGGCFLQTESEIAAINMVLGASAAGARMSRTCASSSIGAPSGCWFRMTREEPRHASAPALSAAIHFWR